MVKSVEVKNFKSISDLKIELGRINVFIGENGSGKSNILEAIAFGAAASARKLDREFLTSRGMRVPEPSLMRSAFDKENLEKDVYISFIVGNGDKSADVKTEYFLENTNEEFAVWNDKSVEIKSAIKNVVENFVRSKASAKQRETFLKNLNKIFGVENDDIQKLSDLMNDVENEDVSFEVNIEYNPNQPILEKYKIYAPENTSLRKFQDEEAGDPLGIKGEGLFRLIRFFKKHETQHCINTIRDALSVLDWFQDFTISDDLAPGEKNLAIKDRFIDTEIALSQISANEGFLFILFYISLFVSEDTPSFFAIDNLDASFNPKLCKKITQTLVNLAKDEKINKQALFTTHNPFILDGLDLKDDEQRLFVVYRGRKGNTVVKRVMPNERDMPISQQWMSGFFGGLPKNF